MSGPVSIGVLSTFPPTQCGLATFSSALVQQLDRGPGTVGVVRVLDEPAAAAPPYVVSQLLNGSPSSAREAVGRLGGFDVVIVQHEYGIYGGPDGSDVVELVEALTVPVVVVLHTVLQEPTSRQRRILLRLLAAADVAVTMTATARDRLVAHYGASPARVQVVPHGATVHAIGAAHRSVPGRPLVLTWGLLGPGKGIEWAVDAMAGLRDLRPRYLVVGETHPKVLQRQGEAYRESLVERIAVRGVRDIVELDPSYLRVAELAALAARADVVLLPYDSLEQVTSGVLIEAVAAGRPVVSTAFPHAVELLSDGAGLLVPQRDPVALEAALRRVLAEPGLAAGMAAQAARQAPELLWGAVARRYEQLASDLVGAGRVSDLVPTP